MKFSYYTLVNVFLAAGLLTAVFLASLSLMASQTVFGAHNSVVRWVESNSSTLEISWEKVRWPMWFNFSVCNYGSGAIVEILFVPSSCFEQVDSWVPLGTPIEPGQCSEFSVLLNYLCEPPHETSYYTFMVYTFYGSETEVSQLKLVVHVSNQTIYIRPDGTIDPPTAPIERVGDVYTFTGNISGSIVAERDNIVIDGAGYAVLSAGTGSGITLSSRGNVTVKNTKVIGFDYGIHLNYTWGSTVFGITFMSDLYPSPPKIMYHGVWLRDSSNNTISGNTMMYTTQRGILLVSSNDNTVLGNNQMYGENGIYLTGESKHNTISDNIVKHNNRHGILLDQFSNENTVSGNTAAFNVYDGINLYYSSNNTVFDNTAMMNRYDIRIDYASGNMVYHNNFVTNGLGEAYTTDSTNTWDDGSSGNFWSNYNGNDLTGDGVGETHYVIDADNKDRYPLIFPVVWNCSNPVPVVWGGAVYPVALSSNSTISMFKFNQQQKQISFDLTGLSGVTGYCNITIPKSLLTNNPWMTTIDGVPQTDYTTTENDTHSFLFFTYTHASTLHVIIQGTSAIPEFPPAMILPILMALTMLVALFTKKKAARRPKT